MKIVRKSMLLAISAMTVTACSSNNDEPEVPGGNDKNTRVDITLTAAQESALADQNEFALTLYSSISNEIKDKNIFLSPISVANVLTMISNGAEGNSYSQIAEALGGDAASTGSLNKVLLSKIASIDKTTALSISNSIWTDYSFDFKDSFKKVNEENSNAEFFKADLSSFDAVNSINSWCDKNTNGMIKQFLFAPPCCNIAFFNAIYFKGVWSRKFSKSETKVSVFYNSDGSSSSPYTMHQTSQFEYAESGETKAIKLPYGNGAFNMIIAMNENGDVNLKDVLGKTVTFVSRKVDFKLPKFEIENTIAPKVLVNAIEKCGVTDIFDAKKANLTGITDLNTSIGCIAQKAVVKVDETGTEAAAVTGGWDGADAGEIQLPVKFYINHPFTFVIQESSTGAILFMGKVNKL